MIIGGSKGPPTADKNPKMTFVTSTAVIIEKILPYTKSELVRVMYVLQNEA